ncbi:MULTISPECIES: hypothetical protein [Pseudomonas]|uniref:hypothetical protein n=1 Tax=Pseudomonas TaxID=286 RepID=UPI0018E7D522|nr:hypothetical protein [Pseudomonas sp. MF7453]MBJ2219770.1 hypothetical protein [Pseudomonas sp. MF7453]
MQIVMFMGALVGFTGLNFCILRHVFSSEKISRVACIFSNPLTTCARYPLRFAPVDWRSSFAAVQRPGNSWIDRCVGDFKSLERLAMEQKMLTLA